MEKDHRQRSLSSPAPHPHRWHDRLWHRHEEDRRRAPFEPSCVLVFGPGKYRFIDFVKVGNGLTLILVVTVLLLIPVFWPLQ